MLITPPFEIFLSTPPGLEALLLDEVQEAGFVSPRKIVGGVITSGGWAEVWRANLVLRGPSKVLVRIGEFRAFHLAQLDKRARKFPWGDILTPGLSVRFEVNTNRKSKIYHAGAAVERFERAITESFDATISETADAADVVFKVRIDDNNVQISVDSSGDGLHKRGHKLGVGKAPIRETMAALVLRGCGYDGAEPVVDPMCGSGTFIIEAAEIARGLIAGRARGFAFEKLVSFEPDAYEFTKVKIAQDAPDVTPRFFGSDRNVNVTEMAKANAQRAGVADICTFTPQPIAALKRPDGPPGLVIVNPPYGSRIGKKLDLFALYKSFGDVMRAEFSGWRIGMITADSNLAKATELPWKPLGAPIAHGGLRVKLYQTDTL